MSHFNASIKSAKTKVGLSADKTGLVVQIDGWRVGVLLEVETTSKGDIIKVYRTDGEVNIARETSLIEPVLIISERN